MVEQILRNLRRDGPGLLAINAHNLVALSDHSGFCDCRYFGTCDEPVAGGTDPQELTSSGIIPDDPDEYRGGTQVADIVRHVTGSAGPGVFTLNTKDRYRCFRRYAINTAENIAIQYGVPHYEYLQMRETGCQTPEAGSADHEATTGPFFSSSARFNPGRKGMVIKKNSRNWISVSPQLYSKNPAVMKAMTRKRDPVVTAD